MTEGMKKRNLLTKSVLQRYWSRTRTQGPLVSVAVFGVVMMEAANIISPLVLSNIINQIATLSQEPASARILFALLGAYLASSILGWVGGRIEMGAGLAVIVRVSSRLMYEAYEHLMHHSHNFFTSSFSGALTQRVRRYAGSFESLYLSAQTVILPAILYILGITVVLSLRSPLLGIILFVWVLLFVLVQWLMVRAQRPYRLARAVEDTKITATLADSISNQNTVLLFAGNAFENKRIAGAIDEFKKAWDKVWKGDLLIYGIQGLLSISVNIALLAGAIHYWGIGVLTIGDIVLVQSYAFGLFGNVWNLGRQFRTIYASIADASEMVEILQKKHDIEDMPRAKNLKVGAGVINFSDVIFGFQDGRKVLQKFNIRISAGEKVAFVGLSGAGKTTITKLLLRMYNIEKGAILIDGQNIAEVTQQSLRKAIAFVPQEPILFHRTLKENIRYGKLDATDEEVIEAATQAHCHEFISQLPLGYDTFVGERGVKLSGGERQRVAIARAILKNAPVLVLDEATSSLDSESEHLIQDALETLMRGKTVIVIAHRLSTIMKMDRILVMEEGKIVAQGTHKELLEMEGLYKKLWSIQAGGFLVDPDEVDKESEELPEEIMEENDEALAEDEARK
jgi:ATP-binding cassette subfamily B protein